MANCKSAGLGESSSKSRLRRQAVVFAASSRNLIAAMQDWTLVRVTDEVRVKEAVVVLKYVK